MNGAQREIIVRHFRFSQSTNFSTANS